MPIKDKDEKRRYQREWVKKKRLTGWTDYRPRKRDDWRTKSREWSKWFVTLKATLACRQCGKSHPAIVDFHHRCPEEKLFEVGRGVNHCKPKHLILAEIEKCDVLCANCHRILHWDLEQHKLGE
jgi:hypothetical protein